MGCVCQCLFRVCCHDRENEEEEDNASQGSSSSHVDLSLPADHPVQIRADRESGELDESTSNQTPRDFWAFFNGFLNNGLGRGYRVVPGSDEENAGLFWSSASWRARTINSPLRTASSFDASSSCGTPAIETDEIVLPGSQLQLDMAKQMAAKLESQDDECVICMEGFDESNPRMPTLCGCGENKTYFHLPCLYQWIDRSEECPSCRKKITWEEF